MRRASRIASVRRSGSPRAVSSASRSPMSATPSSCAAWACRLRSLLLGRSAPGSGSSPSAVTVGFSLAGTILPDSGWNQAGVMQQDAADDARRGQLRDVVSFALQEARRRGASQAEADASINKGLSVTVRLGEVETVEYQRDRGLGVTVY